jgi:hypothetical protein
VQAWQNCLGSHPIHFAYRLGNDPRPSCAEMSVEDSWVIGFVEMIVAMIQDIPHCIGDIIQDIPHCIGDVASALWPTWFEDKKSTSIGVLW